MLVPTISVSESGFWPTPSASDCQRGGTMTDNMTGCSLVQVVNTPTYWPTPQARDYRSGDAPDSPRAQRKMAAKWSPNLNDMVMWPTPVASASKGSSPAALTRKDGRDRSTDRLDHAVMKSDGGQLNPNWVEWLMGWPIGHTALEPLETGRFQEWQQQHSIY